MKHHGFGTPPKGRLVRFVELLVCVLAIAQLSHASRAEAAGVADPTIEQCDPGAYCEVITVTAPPPPSSPYPLHEAWMIEVQRPESIDADQWGTARIFTVPGDAAQPPSPLDDAHAQCLANVAILDGYCRDRATSICGLAAATYRHLKPEAVLPVVVFGTAGCTVIYQEFACSPGSIGHEASVESCNKTKLCLEKGLPLDQCGYDWWRFLAGGDFHNPWPTPAPTHEPEPQVSICDTKPWLEVCW